MTSNLLKNIWQTEGLTGLSKGIIPRSLHLFPLMIGFKSVQEFRHRFLNSEYLDEVKSDLKQGQ